METVTRTGGLACGEDARSRVIGGSGRGVVIPAVSEGAAIVAVGFLVFVKAVQVQVQVQVDELARMVGEAHFAGLPSLDIAGSPRSSLCPRKRISGTSF